ncbi:MAG: epoxyqueuosine reductase QueH [Nitrospirae bacterium]|nr:epoxyqueuosine reductase QueH [Nitrospirota bacterium]
MSLQKPKLLLHICCAPCSTAVIERLKDKFEITGYFYDPNIHPEEEYMRRLGEAKELYNKIGIPLIEAQYDAEIWFKLTENLKQELEGGKRCKVCYDMRLEKAAEFAKENGFDIFTTVLSISPHKKASVINSIGRGLSEKYGIKFYEADFKKKDGFKRSLELSRKYNLYRQDYCGCIYSKLLFLLLALLHLFQDIIQILLALFPFLAADFLYL